MAKYSKRPDGLYVANRTINGKRKVFYAKTTREMDAKILAYMQSLTDGPTFREVAEEWWNLKQREVRPSTTATYRAPYERLVEAFGGRRIREIKPPELRTFMAELRRSGYHRSTGTTNATVMRQIFRFAVENGDLEVSPAAVVRVPRQMPTDKIPALTEAQEAAAKAFTQGQAGLLVQVLLYTGMRLGEAAALTYADIDRKAGWIHVSKKISYVNSRGDLDDFLKTENGLRDIRLLPPLRAVLPKNRIGYVFPGRDGGWMSAYEIRQLWKEFCAACGFLDGDGHPALRPHQMRHTYATVLYEIGVEIKTAALWMGDREEIVSGIYQSLRPNQVQADVEKVDAYYAKVDAEA